MLTILTFSSEFLIHNSNFFSSELQETKSKLWDKKLQLWFKLFYPVAETGFQ